MSLPAWPAASVRAVTMRSPAAPASLTRTTSTTVSFVSSSTQPSSAVTTSGTTNISAERPLVAAEALRDAARDGEDPARAHSTAPGRPPPDIGPPPIGSAGAAWIGLPCASRPESTRNAASRLSVPAFAPQLGTGAAPDDLAVAHEHELVAAIGLVHDVARDEDRRAVCGEAPEVCPELDSQRGVDADRRLVEEQHVWLVDERAGEREPAAHAARELQCGGVPALLELDKVQHAIDRRALGVALEAREEAEVLARPTARGRSPRPGACSRSRPAPSATASSCPGSAPHRRTPGETGQQSDQRRLARAVRPSRP